MNSQSKILGHFVFFLGSKSLAQHKACIFVRPSTFMIFCIEHTWQRPNQHHHHVHLALNYQSLMALPSLIQKNTDASLVRSNQLHLLSINCASTFTPPPRLIGLATKRVLRYLEGTADHGLLYTSTSLQLNAFCDDDWAGSPDDHRSTSGSAIFLDNCLIS